MANDINDDPIVLYLIVRSSLNMNPGKVGSQIGHAVQYLMMHYFKAQVLKTKLKSDDVLFPKVEEEHIKKTTEWLASKSAKVLLSANDEEWRSIKSEVKDLILVKDAGYNDVEPGAETILGLWPQHKSEAITLIKRLLLY